MIVYAVGSDIVGRLRIVKRWRADTCSNVFILERLNRLLWWSSWDSACQAKDKAQADVWVKQWKLVKTPEAEEEDRDVYLPTCASDGI